MSVKKKIYLYGPIMDEHPELAATWRERAKEGLRDHFTLLDPSPLAPLADLLLLTPMKFITFVDPLAAPMALVHALLIGLFLRDPERSRHQVQIFEDFWKENRLFLRKDMDIIGLL